MKAIDLFAGFGGFTLGAEDAGIDVVYAANHWPLAVAAHQFNHPTTRHACQDLRQADWSLLPDYDLLLASPACQGHSEASQPKRRKYHDALRATAWAVIDCAEVTRPKAFIVENVPAFARWELYDLWKEALRRLGYAIQEHAIMATAFGVAQRRERLFIFGTKKLANLHLPFSSPKEPEFAPHVDWAAPGWRPVTKAAPNAQLRIAKGRRNHGATFLSQHVTGHPGVPLHEPIRTITTKDQWIIVDGDRYRPLTIGELARGMGFPDRYQWPTGTPRADVIRGIGNAVCPPVAKGLVERVAAVMS